MAHLQSNLIVGAALGGGGTTGVAGSPVAIARPRLGFRLAGPVLLLVGLAAVSRGMVVGVPLALAGLGVATLWWPRVTVDESTLTVRGLRGTRIIPLSAIEAVRLRRVPFGRPRPPARTRRFGRFSSTPIRLRAMAGDEYVAQLTVVWWGHWPQLVESLLAVPSITSDSRTRGRLERYG